MGGSLSKKRPPSERPRNLKLMVLGDRKVGRTCLIIANSQKEFSSEEYIPSFLDCKSANCVYQETPFQLSWDAGENNPLRPLLYPGTDIFFVCYSVENPFSLENIKARWVPEIHEHCPNTPFIVVGLKTDLRDDEETIEQLRRKGMHIVSQEEGRNFALEVGATQYVECSSKTLDGVAEVFCMINHVMFDDDPPLLSPTPYNIKRAKR